jgi:adenylyltransferase/sulfurtransferase
MPRSSLSEFSLSDSKLDIRKLKQDLENPQAGAVVTFEGWVRNHNEGQPVDRLDYEAFEALAETEGNRIIQEALDRFDILDAVCVHRTGRLIIGDCAVWVGVTSAHRDAAFQATRYIIDHIKTRLPIWKKEHYKSGEAFWVNCQQCTNHSHAIKHEHQPIEKMRASVLETRMDVHPAPVSSVDQAMVAPNPPVLPLISEADYYQRQTVLTQVGPDGQRKLKQAKVLVVGAGGLGSSALLYLAGAGVGFIGICEFDRLEASNLHRQVLYRATEVGQSKAELAARHLQALNPHCKVSIHAEKLTGDAVESLLEPYDLILDCTDNFSARFLMNDAAVRLGKPLIQASLYQYEGQVQLIRPGFGGCLRCQWPQWSSENPPLDAPLGNCAESGVLGAVPGILGAMQAMEAIKLIVGLPTPLQQNLLIMDMLTWQSRSLRRAVRPDCPVCGGSVVQQAVSEPADDDAALEPDSVWELEFETADHRLAQFVLIDVNEAREHVPIPDLTVKNIPFSRFELDHPPPLDKENRYLLYCSKGIRSTHLARELRKRGYKNVFAVAGGLVRQDLAALRKRELEEARLFYVRH